MSLRTPLYDTHQALGAKLIPFAGYDMPVRYTGDVQEHMAVRTAAGLFDVSHMGEFIIRGPKALALIQQVTTNDASKLPEGKAQYSCMPNREGGIVDDVIVYHIREDQYMMVVNASNIEKDWNWVSAHNESIGAELINVSDQTSLIAVSGPRAEEVVQQFTDVDLSKLGTYECFKGVFDGAEKTLVATTGYTGERTFEIFLYNEHAVRVWNDLLAAGQSVGLIPCGLGARDTLRLEMGYMLYGNDINDTTSPLEAGLGWITKLNKAPFTGAEAIFALKVQGLSRKLVAFELIDKGIPRVGYEIAVNGEVVGSVCSGSVSPVLGKGIGMGYVPVQYSAEGSELEIIIRNKPLKAVVVKAPFLKR
ncbi:MAG: glycine cleavage system aminomethyltransferase GcvT [Bacteroidetes bacterium]|nr:MAG: glycine cleavage system aminomethyltransferase GcvT [Bacteroidota bacterium]